MATTTIKSTYSLDPGTVRDLEQLAQRLGISKSEVLRRAVRFLAQQESRPSGDGLGALDDLQESVQMTEERASAWVDRVRHERAEMGPGRRPV